MPGPFSPLYELPAGALAWDAETFTSPEWAPPDPDDGPWEYLGSYYPTQQPDSAGRLPAKSLQDICDVWCSVDPQDTLIIYRVVDGYDFVQYTPDCNDGIGQIVFDSEPEKLAVVRIEDAIRHSAYGFAAGKWAFSSPGYDQLGLVVSALTSKRYQQLVAAAFERVWARMAAEHMGAPPVTKATVQEASRKMWEVVTRWLAEIKRLGQSTKEDSPFSQTGKTSE